jgi:hypothetical protein
VSHRSRPANERGLNSESHTCLSDVPLSHVVAVPDCCSLRTGRVPRVEREIMVVTKSAAPDTLPDSVSASFVVFHVFVETHRMLIGYQPQSLHPPH